MQARGAGGGLEKQEGIRLAQTKVIEIINSSKISCPSYM
jgi:hypothetical protein